MSNTECSNRGSKGKYRVSSKGKGKGMVGTDVHSRRITGLIMGGRPGLPWGIKTFNAVTLREEVSRYKMKSKKQ